MNNKTFFQKIFCKKEVNTYVVEKEEIDENLEFSEKFETILPTEIKNEVVEEKPEIKLESFSLENVINDSKGVGLSTGLMGSDIINENRGFDINKAPVVSGLIFDDVQDSDNQHFVVTNKNEIEDTPLEIDDDANSLIEMLKNEGIEKEKEKEKRMKVEEELSDRVVESEIDMPML